MPYLIFLILVALVAFGVAVEIKTDNQVEAIFLVGVPA